MKESAIKKIEKELSEIKGAGMKVNLIKAHVADVLKGFCKQDGEFAQAIMQQDKTFGECCTKIMSGVVTGISDLEVYRRAVQFYFPGADIHMSMTIDLCASVRDGSPDVSDGSATVTGSSNDIVLDLTEFL